MKVVGIIPEARTRELETLKKQAYHFSFMKGPFLQHDRTQLKLVAISHMYLLKKQKNKKKYLIFIGYINSYPRKSMWV
jgi:hypothetical protein